MFRYTIYFLRRICIKLKCFVKFLQLILLLLVTVLVYTIYLNFLPKQVAYRYATSIFLSGTIYTANCYPVFRMPHFDYTFAILFL